MQKYIAFLDILGFKDLVMNNNHETLVKLFNNLFSVGLQMSISLGQYKYVGVGTETAVSDFQNAKINCLSVSDSVILWTNNDSTISFVDLVATVRNFIRNTMQTGFPLRGAIVIGEMSYLKGDFSVNTSISQQTLIGKGIVDAYLLEGKQKWAGCVIHENAIKKYEEYGKLYSSQNIQDFADLNYLVTKNMIAKYNVPYKDNIFKEEYVVNWPKTQGYILKETDIRKSFSHHNKDIGNEDVELKIRNTVRFLEDMLK